MGVKISIISNQDRFEVLEEALKQIVCWSEAYPLDIFPDPDLVRAAELLGRGGMTLDSISAYNIRHVVKQVDQLARGALAKAHSNTDRR